MTKIIENKESIKIELDDEITNFKDSYDNIFEIDKDELIANIKADLKKHIRTNSESLRRKASKSQSINDFNFFKIDKEKLKIYDESDSNTYPHFLHYYLQNFYIDSRYSNHMYNGGNWIHTPYFPEESNRHYCTTSKEEYLSIKDEITLHLMYGEGVRMYGTGQRYRHVKLESKEKMFEFFDFILESKMFDINSKLTISKKLEEIGSKDFKDHKKKSNSTTVAELLILQCWRTTKDVNTIKYLIDKYGLDLNKVEDVNFDSNIHINILGRLVHKIFDSRAHEGDYWNNPERWEYKSVKASREFFDFLTKTFDMKCMYTENDIKEIHSPYEFIKTFYKKELRFDSIK